MISADSGEEQQLWPSLNSSRRSFRGGADDNSVVYGVHHHHPQHLAQHAATPANTVDNGQPHASEMGVMFVGQTGRDRHPVIERLTNSYDAANHHQPSLTNTPLVVDLNEPIYSTRKNAFAAIAYGHVGRDDVFIEHDTSHQQTADCSPTKSHDKSSTSIGLTDSETSLNHDSGFQRDGFGRQSMSEKRHAQLNAKNTDTYQRNKKAKEERERQRLTADKATEQTLSPYQSGGEATTPKAVAQPLPQPHDLGEWLLVHSIVVCYTAHLCTVVKTCVVIAQQH